MNSDASSINSINKDSYCRHYLDNTEQQKPLQLDHNVTKNHIIQQQQQERHDIDLKNLIDTKNIQKTTVHEKKFVSQSNGSLRQFTPPGDVLAKINTWMKKSKEVIDNRNIQIAHKKQT